MAYLRCPNCRTPLDPTRLTCAQGHRFHYEDGVLMLLADDFATELRDFITGVERFREANDKRLVDESLYEALPYSKARQGDWEWQQRCYDLEHILQQLDPTKPQTILDIGAYNGWLSHQLIQP